MATYSVSDNGGAISLARGLGWFSIGLGLAELFMPDALARLSGVPRRRGLLRLLGLRELASGLAILAQNKPSSGLWSRVGGDMLDLGLLGSSLTSRHARPSRIAAAAAAVAGVTALDVYASRRVGRSPSRKGSAIHVERSVTINRPAAELYEFWHDFERLPDFMTHLHSVKMIEGNRTHWVAKGPAGTQVEWDAELVSDTPNELIAWRSVTGADVDNAGSVRFENAPGGRGTIVRIKLQYSPPAGVLGAKLAMLAGEAPEKQIEVELRRFKQLMEVGEILTTEGQPAGRPSSTSRKYDDFVRA